MRLFPPSGITKRVGQFSWVSISFADRDLILPKSGELDVFPGMRLNPFARAWARKRRERGAARAM